VPEKEISVCLTGATGWLGRSLMEAGQTFDKEVNFSLFGRKDSQILLQSQKTLPVKKFDLKEIGKKDFDIFAPFAFLTRDKALTLSDSEYELANRSIIETSVQVIRSGKAGSVVNLSSGVVSVMSDNQKADSSYSIYARLKEYQEEEFAKACSFAGIPLINCRVFSLSGIDMQEPNKYAIGDLISQALTKKSITLKSRSIVTRRYMDSRDLMYLLLRLAISGNSTSVESGGNKVTLIELSEKILQLLSLSIENITFESDSEVPTNEYFSNRDDLEEYAKRLSFKMTSMEGQIQNVTKAAELQAKN
jgi:nucleoside-diphosphate-sugar epimerase